MALGPVEKYNPMRLYQRQALPLRVWAYILLDYIQFFFLIFLFFILVFVGNQVILLARKVFQVTLPIMDVLELFVYWLPDVITQAIPYAALVACLMSVGNLSSNNEFVAMRSTGISFLYSFVPYIFFSFFVMLLSFFMIEVVLPWGNIQASIQYRKILFSSPQLELDQNSVKRYQDNIIITKNVNDNNIEGLVIIDQDNDGNSRVIVADTAKLIADQRKGVLSLSLNDIVSVSREEKPQEYSYLRAENLTYNLLVKDLSTEVQSITASQKSITDLKKFVDNEFQRNIAPAEKEQRNDVFRSLGATTAYYIQQSVVAANLDNSSLTSPAELTPFAQYYTRYHTLMNTPVFNRNYQIHAVTYHKKMAEPLAVIVFVCIAFPIGLFSRRSGRTIGFGVGISVSFFYWLVTIINQTIGSTNKVSPAFIMWYPNLLIFLIGLTLLYLKRQH